jgi:hypothetical protein
MSYRPAQVRFYVDARTKWGQLEVFMTQWRHIEGLINEPGPFIWRVSRTAMTPLSLT